MSQIAELRDFGLDERQRLVRASVRDFAEKEILPVVDDLERRGEYPIEIIRKAGALGYLGPLVPEEYGGGGMGFLSYGILCEELARADWVTASVVSVQNSLVASGILRAGTDEQKQHWLPRLATGEALSSACLTEPGGGTDLASLRTTARREGDGYVLDGAKVFISHAEHAQVFFVLASVDVSKKHKGVTIFLVDPSTEGVEIHPFDMHTLRRDNIAEVVFENAFVPASARLGEEGAGFPIVGASLDTGRYSVACRCLGAAQAALDASLSYAREREQFGQEIGRFQMIQQMIADMGARIEATRALLYRLGALKDSGAERVSLESSMGKLLASDLAFDAAADAIQIHGGYGLADEYSVGRLLLEAKALQIGEGTNQLQRKLIAEYLLGYR